MIPGISMSDTIRLFSFFLFWRTAHKPIRFMLALQRTKITWIVRRSTAGLR